jgi:hypothetical protein
MKRIKRLLLSAAFVGSSVAPAFAGDGGTQDSVGALIVQAVGHAISKLIGLF